VKLWNNRLFLPWHILGNFFFSFLKSVLWYFGYNDWYRIKERRVRPQIEMRDFPWPLRDVALLILIYLPIIAQCNEYINNSWQLISAPPNYFKLMDSFNFMNQTKILKTLQRRLILLATPYFCSSQASLFSRLAFLRVEIILCRSPASQVDSHFYNGEVTWMKRVENVSRNFHRRPIHQPLSNKIALERQKWRQLAIFVFEQNYSS